jgi:hypothetical protein
MLLLVLSASATAASPELFTSFPEDQVSGSDAGRMDNPRGMAGSPLTGDLYVADGLNARIDVFTAWGEFRLAWGWGVRDGSAELQTCGPDATPPGDICLAGLSGSGGGQFGFPGGVAVDPVNGDVYVVDITNRRVEKFTSEGEFLLTFGGGVDQVTGADVCTVAAQCGPGSEGSAAGEFGFWTFGNYVAVGPDRVVYVGDQDRIQEFEPDGTYKGEIGLPAEGEVKGGTPGGEGLTRAIAIGPDGTLYFVFSQQYFGAVQHPEIFEHTGAGWQVFAETEFPKALAVDQAGNVFVGMQRDDASATEEILEFDAAGGCVVCAGARLGQPPTGSFATHVEIMGIATDSGCGPTGIYASYFSGFQNESFVRGYGATPDTTKCPPPAVPPTIGAEYAISVGSEDATLGAEINPRFWADTTYFIQYGINPCSATSCESSILAPGAPLGAGAVGKLVKTAGDQITGLLPGVTYHYRFVAASGGGGPVYGQERTFTTFPAPAGSGGGCPNDAFRVGASSFLPGCRAYEMVSPVDKNGGDAVLLGELARFAELNQSSSDGSRFTFASKSAFSGAQSAPGINQYISVRDQAQGWQTRSISPPRDNDVPAGSATARGQLAFKAFSDDLCRSWLTTNTGPALAPGAVAGFANLYRRDDCPAESYTALTTVQPVGQDSGGYQPELQGLAAGGSCAVFRANGNLNGESSGSPTNYEVYENCDGGLRVVSRLPNGSASGVDSSVGTASAGAFVNGREVTVEGAVSADGSIVYWTAAEGGKSEIFVRVNARQAQSKISVGKCTESARACTYPVSGTTGVAGSAQFWAGAADAQLAYFTVGDFAHGQGTLFGFDLASKAVAGPIAGEVAGVLGASDDGSRLYFASYEDLTGAEENGFGDAAVAGKPNLYLLEGGAAAGTVRFVANLSPQDVPSDSAVSNPADPQPIQHTSRVSADGVHLAYMSTASPTGYDNTDVASGRADAEVYLYDAAANSLTCPSCSPSGARPSGREVERGANGLPGLWASARLVSSETQLYSERALAEDGSFLIFESFDGLVHRDANHRQDVYLWEASASAADCEGRGAGLFVPASAGCLSLISDGTSSEDSKFLDASRSGSDIFFATEASLLPQDPDSIDVYDARVNGGFPIVTVPPECQGEECQAHSGPPNDPTPASSTYHGPGNAKPGRRCAKGKHKVRINGKVKCRPKHRRHRHVHHHRGEKR